MDLTVELLPTVQKREMMFRSKPRTATVLAAAGSLFLVAGCGQSAADTGSGESAAAGDDTITFAAVPSEESESLQSQYEAIIKLLEQETGKTVEFQDATDYAAVIEGQRAGKIDLAGYGPFSYVIAADGGVPVEPVASLVDGPDENPGYRSFGWVPADSDITDLAGFEGKTVCFVDAASTSGFLYPSAGLLDLGIDPEADVEQVMAGGHDASLIAIDSGQCDAGFAYDAMGEALVDGGQLEEGAVKVVWESELIMGSPVAMNTESLDAETQDIIRTALTEKANVDYLVQEGLCDDAESCVLPEESTWGFVPVEDSEYDGVREVCEVTKAEACNA